MEALGPHRSISGLYRALPADARIIPPGRGIAVKCIFYIPDFAECRIHELAEFEDPFSKIHQREEIKRVFPTAHCIPSRAVGAMDTL